MRVRALGFIAILLVVGTTTQAATQKCDASKLKSAGKAASAILKAYANNLTVPNNAKLTKALSTAENALLKQFGTAETNQCSVAGDAPEAFVTVKEFADRLAKPMDIVLTGEVVPTALGNVTADGKIVVLSTGELSGQISVTLTPGVMAVVEPTLVGGLQATVGGHVLRIDPTSSSVTLDGNAVSLDDVAARLVADIQASSDIHTWSPTSQAWLAALGVTSTPSWQANLQAELAASMSRGARAPSALCHTSVRIGSGVFSWLIQKLGCVGVTLVCVGPTLPLDGVSLGCTAAGIGCEIFLTAANDGLDATGALTRWMDSLICSSHVCSAYSDTRPCYTGDPATRSVGACHDGTEVCRPDGSGFGGCADEQLPTTEICDNHQDDDCNGFADGADPACGGPPLISRLPDTGQTTVYHSGDDGTFFSGCQPSYTDYGDGTVNDNCTGLMWAQNGSPWNPADGISWPRAIDYCETSTLAGWSDWRLPNVRELTSIMNYGSASFLPTVFQLPATMSGWSGTTYATDPGFGWRVDFAGGGVTAGDKNATSSALCVRSVGAGLPETGSTLETYPGDDTYYNTGCGPSYIDNADGTITDACTGLYWISLPYNYAWSDAVNACSVLVSAGHGDWRVPNIRELQSIADYGTTDSMTDPTFDILGRPGNLWSSSSYDSSQAWKVAFNYHGGPTGAGLSDKGIANGAWCVRGGI